MLLSVFFFSTQDVQVKYLSSYYNIFFISWIKSITQLLVVFAFLHIKSKKNYFVSLNPSKEIDPSLVYYQTLYSHPVYDSDTLNAQKKLNALQGENGLYFAGAKMGFGFHEDGLNSGLDVAKLLGCEPSWSKREM